MTALGLAVRVKSPPAARSRHRSLNELVNRLIHDYLVAHDREQVRRWHEEQAAEHDERVDRIR